jgi:hypothetical protein
MAEHKMDKEEQDYIDNRNRADQDFITKEALRILREQEAKKNGTRNRSDDRQPRR